MRRMKELSLKKHKLNQEKNQTARANLLWTASGSSLANTHFSGDDWYER